MKTTPFFLDLLKYFQSFTLLFSFRVVDLNAIVISLRRRRRAHAQFYRICQITFRFPVHRLRPLLFDRYPSSTFSRFAVVAASATSFFDMGTFFLSRCCFSIFLSCLCCAWYCLHNAICHPSHSNRPIPHSPRPNLPRSNHVTIPKQVSPATPATSGGLRVESIRTPAKSASTSLGASRP